MELEGGPQDMKVLIKNINLNKILIWSNSTIQNRMYVCWIVTDPSSHQQPTNVSEKNILGLLGQPLTDG